MTDLIKDYDNLMQYINESGDKLDAKSRSLLVAQAIKERQELIEAELNLQTQLKYEEEQNKTLPDREQAILKEIDYVRRIRRQTRWLIILAILISTIIGGAIYGKTQVSLKQAQRAANDYKTKEQITKDYYERKLHNLNDRFLFLAKQRHIATNNCDLLLGWSRTAFRCNNLGLDAIDKLLPDLRRKM